MLITISFQQGKQCERSLASLTFGFPYVNNPLYVCQVHHLQVLVALNALEGMQVGSAGAFYAVVFTLLLTDLQ